MAASENTPEFLGIPLNLILGTPVDTVLEREVLAVVRGLTTKEELPGQITYLGSFPLKGELYSALTHIVEGQRVLEFERVERLASPELMNAIITNFVGRLGKLTNEIELCKAITKQVADLTGFNRVLLYSFDEAGHGTVLVEENDGTLPSYLNLRFPASDIPRQARELYLFNTVRVIPNASYVPSPLSGVAGTPMRSFDLSSSVLRSVSPIHLEYMRNMGTMASMSISLVWEGKLWGLISSHNEAPRSVSYVVRSACDLLTKMVGTQLMAFQSATQLEKANHFHGVQRRILTHMAAENDYLSAMRSQLSELIQITNAEGVVLLVDGLWERSGITPPASALLRLASWMDEQPGLGLFSSKHLQSELTWAKDIEDVASGLVAIRISDVRQSYVMWFRPQIVQSIKWAGEPVKARDSDGGLHPRASFNAWQELVHGQSAPWTEMEIGSAQEFRTAVMTINLKRAEEAVDVSESRFQEFTNSLPNLVWAANDDGRLSYVNKPWKDAGLIANGIWYEQHRLSPEVRLRCASLWVEAVRDGSSFDEEIPLQGGTGSVEHWYLVRAVPFHRSDGERVGWGGAHSTDLTERREREMALRMTEKLALTGRMTSVIAHEINNPLEAITNIHYLLANEVVGNEPALAYIATAGSELERISGITKQTLRWTKEHAETPEWAAVGSLFEESIRLFKGKIKNREISITTQGEDVMYFGVTGQIRQVLVNLISNALDACPVGGSVRLSAEGTADETRISVIDDGCGMSEETQRHLFQPFYSTKGDLGNGLGLYICNEILEKHGGQAAFRKCTWRRNQNDL